ncbi:MAG: glycosyltransferase [Lachnospiraceae bacterium]|nr:glycosyltransferase [Lachnospiraceae bacterium]
MDSILVSVIVPIYNTSQYLEECLGSLKKQTLKNIEIICINDGSTDNSLSILKRVANTDNRIIVIEREEASGSAALPRNEGLAVARGKYVMFLDSDDYFSPDLLEKLYKFAEANSSDLVMCDNYVITPDGGIDENRETELHRQYLPDLKVFSYKNVAKTIFQISNAAVWHKLILRELLEEYSLEFQENTPRLDDIYFVNSLLIVARRISILDEKLVYYRASRPGAQTTRIGENKYSIYFAFKALNDYLKYLNIYETVKQSLQNWTIATMGWWLHSISDYDDFKELFDLYKNKYFEELGLLDLEPSELYDGLEGFYKSITERDFRPSLHVILESLLPENSRLGIYGAGTYGKTVYKLIENCGRHRIVIWCDKNAEKINNPMVSSPVKLNDNDIDAIFIAIMNPVIVKEVKDYLVKIGISYQKILEI